MRKSLRARTDGAASAAEPKGGIVGLVSKGIVTGAADDDPSAIGTYSSAGAAFGLSILWIAPVLLPMMYAVVYISAKIGQVYGKGLFACIRDQFPRYVLAPLVVLAFVGNIIEAAADLGGMGAALNLYVPLPIPVLVGIAAAVIYAIQYFGSYSAIRILFRWLALVLLAYVAAAVMARPSPGAVLFNTLVPHLRFDSQFLGIIVACIGTSLSAYVYTWQSNQEVEEEIANGRVRLWQRKGATRRELRQTRRDVLTGMIFSSIILYFILMATGGTLHPAGSIHIETAAQAAKALEPVAGAGAKWLFTAGLIGVGFLAVPVMTTGAAYNIVQGVGKHASLHEEPQDNALFYAIIAAVTVLAVALNFLGFNPMRALVWSGIVQGFSIPPLLFIMMILTNRKSVMGARVNSRSTNLLGWATTAITLLCTLALVASWIF